MQSLCVMDNHNHTRKPPVFAGRQSGRLQARYSYLTRDKEGTLVRRWHDQVHTLGPLDSDKSRPKSLLGMVRP